MRVRTSTVSGSSARGSGLRSIARATDERDLTHETTGSIAANMIGLRVMETSAAARMRLRPSLDRRPSSPPRPARMKENSPIWASPAPTVSAVLSG